MSCRPRAPSDRPLYDYYDLELAGNQAPRLPAQSLASRLLLTGLVVCCCGIVALSLLFALSLFASLPHITAAGPMGSGEVPVAIENRVATATHSPAHRTQHSVLARLSTLKRATLPVTGATRDSMKLAFPHWFPAGDPDDLSWREAVADIALALSYLAQEDNQREVVATRP